ncbi:MAG: NAD-dependent epimerase/dehydratase family protein [Dehalococcoidia bacterium]|nr:MAG: NAD-dependent epimerase/dehydratase family protein [Dehalococcoidia bacterium]
MRVLVAGGAGFLGSHVCDELLERGHEVVCLDNLITGRLRNIEHLEPHAGFTFLREDVVRAPLLPVDLVLHMASPASPVHYQRFAIETMLANSAGTHRLAALAADVGARFVFASTSEVYGDPLEHPQAESYWGNVNPVGPRACYDESKRFGESLTAEYRRKHGINASIVRIFNTYGPRMDLDDGRVVSEFAAAALRGEPLPIFGDGTQTRSFCYVSDLVDALLLVALDGSADGEVLNIGNPHEVSMLELAETIASAAGAGGVVVHLPAAVDDPARRRPDISRLQARYGWSPCVPLEEGIARTVEYFREEIEARAGARHDVLSTEAA